MTYRSDSSSPFSRILGLRARQCACHSAQCQRLHQRVTEDLSRRHFLGGMAWRPSPCPRRRWRRRPRWPMTPAAADQPAPVRRLGHGGARGRAGAGQGKRIADLLPASATVEARVLDCQGKLLLPG